jgi:tRNA-specific 2-thiouridylase
MSKKRVAVGMSGGVDSSVAAYLLKEQGYDVIGLFMHNWEENDDSGACTAESDFEDVRRVCANIGIPYYTVNFAKEYKERVFSLFLEEYKLGRTPNPDVLCNREIKFGPFLDYAKKMGADRIATGHYAGVENTEAAARARADAEAVPDSVAPTEGGRYLKKAADTEKDQTYFLNQLTQAQLRDVIFPLCDLKKSAVRKIAAERGFSCAAKKDSTGICFIGERKFQKFLSEYIPAKRGAIKTLSGATVGEHNGVMYYTIGQARGLGLGGKADFEPQKWFVVDKDVKNNVLYVGQGDDGALYKSDLVAAELNFIPKMPAENFECYVKIRYRQAEQRAAVSVRGGKAYVKFEKPQRAVTSGQYAVFYNQKYCLGGGVIL